jgi:hypothetical protein
LKQKSKNAIVKKQNLTFKAFDFVYQKVACAGGFQIAQRPNWLKKEMYEYLKSNGVSERHQHNTLKVMIPFVKGEFGNSSQVSYSGICIAER